MAKAVYLVGSVEKAADDYSSARRVGRCDLVGGQAEARALRGKNLCVGGTQQKPQGHQQVGRFPGAMAFHYRACPAVG